MSLNETIFLTGFPGFIAGRLVERLARQDARFLLLVQSAFVARAREEVARIAHETGAPIENFRILEGDITQPDLGLARASMEIARAETTLLFHLAAVYDLGVRRDVALRVNVEGTRNVNQFALTLSGLRRYHYVSTCYVAGLRRGEILETELEHNAGFRNFYEETKYLAEQSVERLKGKIPTTILRPSVVVGDSETGETQKYDGIYSLVLYLRKAPRLLRFINVGNDRVKLNLVPVDFVVEAIAALSKDKGAIGKTVALADPNPLTTAELFDAIAENLTGKRSVIKPPGKLIEKSLMLPFSPRLSGLPFPAVPYFFVPQTYDTRAADELLAKHNIHCPNFKSYIENLLKFVEKNPKL